MTKNIDIHNFIQKKHKKKILIPYFNLYTLNTNMVPSLNSCILETFR